MSKALTVFVAEYGRAVRTKAFLVGVLLTPLLFGGGAIAVAVSESSKDVRERQFAVIDRSEVLLPEIAGWLEQRNANEIMQDGEQVAGRWTLLPAEPPADGSRLDLHLSKRVEDGELLGFLVIGKDLPSAEGGDDQALSWHTTSPTYDDLSDWLEWNLNDHLRRQRLGGAGIDAELAGRLSRRENVAVLGPMKLDAQGLVKEDTELGQMAKVMVPVVLLVFMFMLVMMSTPALLNNVLEEKMQKIVEVLVSSVSPFDLLLGKLLAAVGVSLSLAVIYLGGGLVFLHTMDGIPTPILDAVTPAMLGWFVLLLLLSLTICGSIFSALGAACSEIQDAQTLMTPAMIVLVVPMMFLGPLIKSPDGVLARVLTFIPPITPSVLFFRLNAPPGVGALEAVLALALCLVFAFFAVKGAAKVFRIGVLSQGQAPSYRKLLSWMLSD